ncbi:hypothetical protein H4Q26_015715 [Puccinia striiformis f. sp. tritici PST-130]|nr:hypothetical protein H4Q26_015715 [Puccinia striiformis f. sp. tritici PST-130]
MNTSGTVKSIIEGGDQSGRDPLTELRSDSIDLRAAPWAHRVRGKSDGRDALRSCLGFHRLQAVAKGLSIMKTRPVTGWWPTPGILNGHCHS